MSKDYYKILEVQENASIDEIKNKYRQLSKKYHPDVNSEGEEKFKEINEAYSVLSDSNKRAQYDSSRRFNPFDGFRFERREESLDLILQLIITVTDSFLGVKKTINYKRNQECSSCSGFGGNKTNCGSCGGSGVIRQNIGNSFFSQIFQMSCPSCGGQGYILKDVCNKCSGKGHTLKDETIDIMIPHGINTNNFLKISGYGNIGNNRSGNLVLVFSVSDDDFKRDGDNLIYHKTISSTNICDEYIDVNHPSGNLKLKLPQIYNTYTPLRVKGKGFNGADFLIKLDILVEK